MNYSVARSSMVVLFAALAASGCSCERKGTNRAFADFGIVFPDPNDPTATKTSREAIYDFGMVFMGKTETRNLTIMNSGKGALTLVKLEKEEGDAITIGDSAEANSVFQVEFTPGGTVATSEQAIFPMHFMPPQQPDPNITTENHGVKMILRTQGTVPGEDTAEITLKAIAVAGACELPNPVDFGNVAKGDTYTITTVIRNPSQLNVTPLVGDVYSTSGDHQAFGFTPDSPRGSFTIESGKSREVKMTFTPTQTKEYKAFIKWRASAECPEILSEVIGNGIDAVLTWDPKLVDFLYAQPGATLTRDVTFKNLGNSDVTVSVVKIDLPVFKVVGAGTDANKLLVPGKGGEAKLTFSATPNKLGPIQAQATFQTNLAKQATGAITLKVFGGGPQIQVNPSPTLNFGKVAYFAGATPPSFQKRKLTVLNVGTKPATADPKANLKLGKDDGSSTQTYIKPYFELRTANVDTQPGEFAVSADPTPYNPAVGLEATVGKNATDFIVTFTPQSVGRKEADITIFSNDPKNPSITVHVIADSVILPPCQYTVSPTSLNFGMVTPPNYKDLAFSVTNLGQNAGEICLLSNLEIASGSDPAFSLPAGSLASLEIQPNSSASVLVRVWPQGAVNNQQITNIAGQAQFFMSSPTVPQASVSLAASVANGCLTVAPSDLNFGTVQKGCYSATRTFSIYNTCQSPVTIPSGAFSLQAAGGQPAGGPDCPGVSPCPEFFLVSIPPIPPGGLSFAPGAAPLTFQARYKPIDLGSDTGAIRIGVIQNSTPVNYLVTLAGTGDTVGQNVDVFTQDAKPKADILLTIDNSCSMATYQTSLGTNFQSFIQYAMAASVDYHIAVTTTATLCDPSDEQGRMIGDAVNPKILTPQTPDVENKFKQKVAVGTSGCSTESGLMPSLQALTAPLITADNNGFLRNDANLAVVVITDAVDQSANPASFYYNNFLNVKGFQRATMFTFNAIAGFNPSPPGNCPYDTGPDDGRYATLVSQTNGVREEICTPDWSKALEGLGKTAFGFRTNFFLNAYPDTTKPIQVQIDGADIPKVDSRGATVWTYDSTANSVNFEPMFVPEPGQTMTITYFVVCTLI